MSKGNILIMEDEFIISDDLSETLLECGYSVAGIAENVDEANFCRKCGSQDFKNNEPRFYRYQQLKALFQAYNIPFDIKKFRKGKFINNEDIKYAKFVKHIIIETRRFYDGAYLDKAWIQLFD